MNLVIDYGNSRIKSGLFEHSQLREKKYFSSVSEFASYIAAIEFEHVIASSVSHDYDTIRKTLGGKKEIFTLTTELPLPVKLTYSTPQTLGVDRIAAACGSLEYFPDRPRLVIDAGTCINYEFVDEQDQYHGGAISPGVKMRFDAMHKFTARLPLIQQNGELKLTGDSTETCMRSGVLNSIRFEMEGFIDAYKNLYPTVGVILCGGDAFMFENTMKHSIFVAPDLVLSGLNRILLHNVSL